MKLRIFAALTLCLCLAGCDDFERSTFKTLSASKAVINQAQADYECDPTKGCTTRVIPHNKCAYSIINDAKAAQTTAVNAMVVYEQEKVVKGDLTAQTAVVVSTLGQLPNIIGEVKSLYSNPASLCGPGKAGAN